MKTKTPLQITEESLRPLCWREPAATLEEEGITGLREGLRAMNEQTIRGSMFRIIWARYLSDGYDDDDSYDAACEQADGWPLEIAPGLLPEDSNL